MTDILPPINTPAVALSGVNAGRMDGAFYGPLQRTLTSFRAQIQTLTRVVSAVSDADGNLIASADLLADTAELNAIRATLGGGLMVRTPLGDWFARSLTGPAAGITVTFGDGFAGNPTLALANDLAALEGLAATGFAVRTGADTWTQRALAGTAGRIVVTNGDGVAGAPTSDLATVADAGGGTLQKTAFDAYGRKTGTSAATTTDLPEGSNLYHTAQRVRDTLLTGLSTATNAVITATDSVLTALGKLQAQVSGILANYVTTARTISTTAPLTGGGDLSADRTLAISAATTSAAGSMSAADKAKLDGMAQGVSARRSTAATESLVLADVGKTIYAEGPAGQTLTIEPDTVVDWPEGAAIRFVNYAGPFVIARGAGVGLYWLNGAGVSAGVDGNRTVGEYSWARIWQHSSNFWFIEGNNLS